MTEVQKRAYIEVLDNLKRDLMAEDEQTITDNRKYLIHIPKDANYIEILGHRIDGYDSFEAFCEHLKKYAELEETVNRQKAEIERLKEELLESNREIAELYKCKFSAEDVADNIVRARFEAITEFAERLKEKHRRIIDYDEAGFGCQIFIVEENYIDQIAKEMKGEQ